MTIPMTPVAGRVSITPTRLPNDKHGRAIWYWLTERTEECYCIRDPRLPPLTDARIRASDFFVCRVFPLGIPQAAAVEILERSWTMANDGMIFASLDSTASSASPSVEMEVADLQAKLDALTSKIANLGVVAGLQGS